MNELLHHECLMRLPAGYALFSPQDDGTDFRLIEANGAFERALGASAARLESLPLAQAVREGIFPAGLLAALPRSLSAPLETELYVPNTNRWFKACLFSPKAGFTAALLTDITSDKKAPLLEEQSLTMALQEAPIPIFATDFNGVILQANRETFILSGYAPEELLGTGLYRLVERGSRFTGLMFFKELRRNGHAEVQLQAKLKNGRTVWVSLKALRLGDYFIYYCQDISSYKALENELISSELLYRTLLNASSDVIYLKDENLRYLLVNDALTRALGLESSELIGKTHEELSPETAIPEMTASDLHVIRTKESVLEEHAMGRGYFEVFKFPVPIGDGRTGVGAFIRSITQKKRNEELQRRALERHRILADALLMTFQANQGQLEYALQEALKLTDSLCGFIFTYEGDAFVLKTHVGNSPKAEACHDLTAEDLRLLWEKTADVLAPVLENNLPEGAGPGGQICNFLSVPVLSDGRLAAVVSLVNKKGAYDEYDAAELSMLMNGVFMAAEKQRMQKNVESLYEQTQAMFNEHDAVMLLFDPESRRIVEANPAAVAFYGYSKEELLSLKYDDLLAPRVPDSVTTLTEGDHIRFFSSPHRLKSGEVRMVDVYSCPINYFSEKTIFSIIFDVTEREKALEEIKYLSFHDHLTGLYNRRYFDTMIKQLDDPRYYPLALIVSDVNCLKLINDSFGHAQGDELLIKAANLLQQNCRRADICARIGGDEFAIILPNTSAQEAEKIVQRIQRMQSGLKIMQLELSMSFGYAVKQDTSSDIELVFSEAENTMYRNKMNESPPARRRTIDIILKTLYGNGEEELRHAARVAKLSTLIAAEMGLPAADVLLVSEAGLLHDIGKIGIDRELLKKEGPFTRAERLEIERHSESGWRILSNSDEYARLADVILYHHESPDGTGYPRGIRGEEIPLPSRIIAVAEAFDAMTSPSSYRKAVSWEEAARELRSKTGTQFDANVVSVFVDKVLGKIREEDLDAVESFPLIYRLLLKDPPRHSDTESEKGEERED